MSDSIIVNSENIDNRIIIALSSIIDAFGHESDIYEVKIEEDCDFRYFSVYCDECRKEIAVSEMLMGARDEDYMDPKKYSIHDYIDIGLINGHPIDLSHFVDAPILYDQYCSDFDHQWVYCIIAGDNEYIKIGHSTQPNKRIKELQTSCPHKLSLRFILPGNKLFESELHNRFRKYSTNAKNEWFKYSKEIYEYFENGTELMRAKLISNME